MLSDVLGWRGLITVTVRGPGAVQWWTGRNMITDAGLTLLASALNGGDCEIRYVALGSGTAAPTAGDTQLEAESFRKQLTKQGPLSAGVMSTECYIAQSEAVGAIGEIAWFAGPTATAAANSGVLLARVVYSHDKTDLESLTISRTDTIGRA